MTTVKDTTPLAERKFFNNDQTADMLGISRRTLPVWRVQGRGPSFIKLDNKLVRYSEADVIAWIEANTRKSTSAAQA